MERHARMPLLNVSYHVFAVGFYFTGNLRQFFCTISRVMRWHEQMILSEYKSLSYMENCVFCKIASGEFDSARVWEDGEFLAILDLNPNVKGMTLVMTKKHYDSYAIGMPDDVYVRLMSACKNVGKFLDEKLGTVRTAMVMEGMGVIHVYVKLFPMHGLGREFRSMESAGRAFFDAYPGYISTVLGPKAGLSGLKKMAEEIRE